MKLRLISLVQACGILILIGCSGGSGTVTASVAPAPGTPQTLAGTFTTSTAPQASSSSVTTSWSGDILKCVTLTLPQADGQATISSTGAVSISLTSAGAPFGCFLVCPTSGDTYCAAHSLGAGTVIAPLVFNGMTNTTIVYGDTTQTTVSLGTIGVNLDANGNVTAVASVGSQGIYPTINTPPGLACLTGSWFVATSCPGSGILTRNIFVAQNLDGTYTGSMTQTSSGCANETNSSLPMTSVSINSSSTAATFSFRQSCQDLNPTMPIAVNTTLGKYLGITAVCAGSPGATLPCCDSTGATCYDGIGTAYAKTASTATAPGSVTYSPFEVLSGQMASCSTAGGNSYCNTGAANGCSNGNAIYGQTGDLHCALAPVAGCGSNSTTACLSNGTGGTLGAYYDGSGHTYGPAASCDTTLQTAALTLPVNQDCNLMQTYGSASGVNPGTGAPGFGNWTNVQNGCAVCIQGAWSTSGCLGSGSVTCTGTNNCSATQSAATCSGGNQTSIQNVTKQ